jgi:hypothetical protein
MSKDNPTDERLLRVERAVLELAAGVALVHGRGHLGAATAEIQAEFDATADAKARKLRQTALETELASLRAA